MKKCVFFVQIQIERVSMKGNVMGVFLEKKCVGEPQQPLGFVMALNMWDLARCLEPNNLHHRPQLHPTIGFGFVTTSFLNYQAHGFFSIL